MEDIIKLLNELITKTPSDQPLLVGIDGIDASGKTTFAKQLSKQLRNIDRQIICASIDGFHNPQDIRYRQGANSSEGYYLDSFDYIALLKYLLEPIKKGERKVKTKIFDLENNKTIKGFEKTIEPGCILIMEGIFLFRPELIKYWDIKIFLDITFETSLGRALNREKDIKKLGDQIKLKYSQRYIPGQKLYFKEAKPKERADIVINNNNFEKPRLIINRLPKTS